jgi:hypothetical protein
MRARLLAIFAVVVSGCAASPKVAVPDRATALKIAQDQCGIENENWRVTEHAGGYWTLWSDRFHVAAIRESDGMVEECAHSIP